MTPHELTPMFPSLPPILYINYRIPISSYSKALRGLSVQSRVIRIFTYNTISPGPLLRQRPSRYAIRAGRNLPDKEFRYLRTFDLAETCVFGKQSLGPLHCGLQSRLPFSRSYGVILQSSLTRVLPSVLGFSPRPPVSVCGTGA